MTKVEINCTLNGLCIVMVDNKASVALCRCGSSSNKPYCDGTHTRIGFKAEANEIKIL
jgi:CDGSH-type Zn-finger protein